jgi:hypothetical protein
MVKAQEISLKYAWGCSWDLRVHYGENGSHSKFQGQAEDKTWMSSSQIPTHILCWHFVGKTLPRYI